MSTPTKLDLYQTVTDQIISILEAGTIPWQRPWRGGPPMNAITKNPYHGVNYWLLLNQPYESNLYLTFNQAMQAGGTVRRNEHGHLIVYVYRKEEDDAEPEENASKNAKSIFRYRRVFNIEQCEGLDVSITAKEVGAEVNPILMCENIVAGMPQAPNIRFGGSAAYYHIEHDYVNMPKMRRFWDAEGYYNVLFHELTHSTGHGSRLNRPTMAEMFEFGSDRYSNEELIAELGSAYLCSYAGIGKHIQNSAAYIAGWLSRLRNDRKIMLHASSYAQKAVDYILGAGEAHSEFETTPIFKKPDLFRLFYVFNKD